MTCKHWTTGQHANAAESCGYCELERQLIVERERADYAWKNTRTIDAARMEEMQKRDKAEAENALLRQALEPFADIRAAGIDALPDSAGFAARTNGRHVTYGDIRKARELLRSNV